MADPLSVHLPAFNFLSSTFAFLRLAQAVSRSVSAFKSFMRKYFYPCIVADQCFQYVDDIGTAAASFEVVATNLKANFKCAEKTGLEFTPGNCEFGLREMTFLGNSINSEGMLHNKTKVTEFLSKLKVPTTVKQNQKTD